MRFGGKANASACLLKLGWGEFSGLEQHRSVRFCGDLILKNLAIGIHMVTKKPLERGAFPNSAGCAFTGLLHFLLHQRGDARVGVHDHPVLYEVEPYQARFPNGQRRYRLPHCRRDWSMHGIPT